MEILLRWAPRLGLVLMLVSLPLIICPAGAIAAQLSLSWADNSPNEAGVSIERSTGSGGAFFEIGRTGPNVTAYTDTSLADSTAYCYRIRAFNSAGYSDYSNVACASTPQIFGLAVVKMGGGSGTVTSSVGGINCGPSCSGTYPKGTAVTLTATPGSDSVFSGWSGGGCTGTGACTVTVTATTIVTATFDLRSATLTVKKSGTGSGTVTSAPAGINCGATCSASFPTTSTVTLNATASPGSTFSGWSGGGCSSTGTCTVPMTAAATVTATFLSTAPDTAAPSVLITAPTSGRTFITRVSSLALAGSAADNVGVTQVSWTNDRGGSGIASGTTAWSVSGISLQPGANVLTVTARDAANNIATAALTVTYDPTPPVVRITAPTAGTTVSGPTTVTATASDNIGVVGLQLLLDGHPLGAEQPGPFSWLWDTTSVPNGAHTLSAQARDAAGNTITAAAITVMVANLQPPGLVAAYAFNEGTGTTAADSSGNNHTATLAGATWTPQGKAGSALLFNGTTAYVNVGNAATLQLTSSMTISAWIKSSAFPRDDAAIVSKRSSANLGFQLDTTVDTGTRTIGFKLTSATGSNMFRYGATPLQLNQWYYVTGVYDAAAKTLNVYLNGQLDNGPLLGSPTATQQNPALNVNIGRRAGLSGYAFNGAIDEVRIYNSALSQSELLTDMAATSGAPAGP